MSSHCCRSPASSNGAGRGESPSKYSQTQGEEMPFQIYPARQNNPRCLCMQQHKKSLPVASRRASVVPSVFTTSDVELGYGVRGGGDSASLCLVEKEMKISPSSNKAKCFIFVASHRISCSTSEWNLGSTPPLHNDDSRSISHCGERPCTL